ncbi:MAG: glycosyltransferase [Acetobacteraceae bacterium]|nr:glycosyltransferase [Pseudomonadota bacterium]
MNWPLDLPAREVLKLPADATIPWAVFDPDWYARTYPDDAEAAGTRDPAALLDHYLQIGQRQGHSPNLFFDEAWHRLRYPAIARGVERGDFASAFDAYCRRGCLDRSPHWLFDELAYRDRYPDLTVDILRDGKLVNRYHHYLTHGSHEDRIGHLLFDPAIYLANFAAEDVTAIREGGVFQHYLQRIDARADELPTSLYFDPAWYVRRYPQVAREIAAGTWRSALHHYLCNDTPTDFDPLPDFSETHYLARDPGLRAAIDSHNFRNGYMHFLRFGAGELRSPTESIDLRAYASQPRVRQDLQHGIAPNAFAHWLSIGKRQGLLPADPIARQALAPIPRETAQRTAVAMLPATGRYGYRFDCDGAPLVSAVLVLRDGFAATLATIGSLRDNISGDVELVVIDRASSDETKALADYVSGVRLLRFDMDLDWVAAANAACQFATAPAILFLDSAAQLAPGAVQRALDRLASDSTIGAVTGMLVQPHGVIGQAGGIVWKSGACDDYQRGQSPLAPEANFVRPVDYGSTAFLLVRADLMTRLGGFDAACAETGHAAVDLCLRIAETGASVVYDPSVVVFCDDAAYRPGEPGEPFLTRHEQTLAQRADRSPAAQLLARQAGPRPPRVLFIEDTVPLRRLGSGFVRANDLVRTLAELGYQVTVFPILGCTQDVARVFHDMPDTVEVMHDRAADRLKELLNARRDYYDVVWIARTHNFDRVQGELAPWLAQHAQRPLVVLDTEAVAPLREAQQARLRGTTYDLDAAMQAAFRHASKADVLVTVSREEENVLRKRGYGPTVIVGHMVEPLLTARSFAQRAGMLFVGAIHSPDSPNYDSLVWFADAVLPLIEEALGWQTRLTVAGYTAPGVDLSRFDRHPRITLRGAVGNLEPLYNSSRVFIAPTRFAAGTPYKVYEAASRGLPVVAADHLVEALDWTHEEEILAAETSPHAFASAVIALYQQEELWRHLREGALRRLRRENNRQSFIDAISRVLTTRPRAGEAAG